MKKLLCLLLSSVILFIFAVATAENGKVEILFRNNPWGASFSEVKKSYPDNIHLLTPMDDKAYELEYKMFGDESAKQYDCFVGCRETLSYTLEGSDFTVAGYPVCETGVYFAYVPEINGLIDHENPKTALYYAYYSIEPLDMTVVYDDLKTKLCSLYGDPVEGKTKDVGGKYETRYISWYGANDTVLSLVWNGNKYIVIKYGWLGGNQLLKNAYNSLVLEESLTSASDVSGL